MLAALDKAPYPPEREVDLTTAALVTACVAGQVIQTQDGKAGVIAGLRSGTLNERQVLYTAGRFIVPKTANIVILDGGSVFWDRANSKAHFNSQGTGYFFLGTAVGDSASADTTLIVDINAQPRYRIDGSAGNWDTAIVKTAGTPTVTRDSFGTQITFSLDNTNEAQKVDALSQAVIATADGPIFEGRLTVSDKGNNAALKISFGLATGTHATDITQASAYALFEFDGNSLEINAQSSDGTTVVAKTDTTVALAAQSTFADFWIDARDVTNVKFYINGVRILSATTFVLAAAAGPFKAILHVVKSANATTAGVKVDFLRARSTDLL